MNIRSAMHTTGGLATTLAGVVLCALPSAGQSTTRVSVDSSGAQGNGYSMAQFPSISDDGRFVAFVSIATNLVMGDTNGAADIFVHDSLGGTTERVSIDSAGAEGNADSYEPSISADSRFVAFKSLASNLVPGDTNGFDDIFVHDRLSATTERVSVDSAGGQGNNFSSSPRISDDGRFVTFLSAATNLVPGITAGQVYVRDRLIGTTECVSIASGGAQGNDFSANPSISAGGRFVAFESLATNLVAGDTNGVYDVFLRDRLHGTTERVSVSTTGAQATSGCTYAVVSADGLFVAFNGSVPGLPAGVLVRDRQLATTECASVSSSGVPGNNGGGFRASISADGQSVGFGSLATNLVVGDTNGVADVFVHDRQSGVTERVSVDSVAAQGNSYSDYSALSGDGRFAAFFSNASNLVVGDTNGFTDVFVRERWYSSPGTDLCQPGAGAVNPCPCSNPPVSAPRGCDNSSSTGGAQLTSSGGASVAFDSLTFITNGERPTAPSILIQGDAEIPAGAVFGQGVRCVGGGLKRLFLKTAVGGSISAPAPGDPSISARSAALGDTIWAGTSRWYAVYYRDPLILGSCPASSGFNITQTQLVNWGA